MAQDFTDQLAGSKRLMAMALLKQAGQPNPSLGGAVGHALAVGLMGLYEGMDERTASNLADKIIQGGASPAASPMGNVPPSPPASIPSSPSIPPQALSGASLSDNAAPMSGGGLPQGGIDRSALVSQLQDPAMVQRMADMTKGEVGFSDPTAAKIQTESALNRTQARNIPLAQALRAVNEGPGGYYASNTYSHPASPSEVASYQRDVLGPALAGSDVGTQVLGFTPTGNASGQFALNRAANGLYASNAWPSGQPGVGEMYVTEKPDAAAVQNLPRLASLGAMLGGPTPGAEPTMPPGAQFAQQGFMPPDSGPQPNITNVPTRPVQLPIGNAPQAAPQAPQAAPPSAPQLAPDPQTQRMLQVYQTASPQEKRILAPMIIQQQNKMRELQLQMQQKMQEKAAPSYGDLPANAAAKAAAESSAKLPNEITLKQTPTSTEKQALDQKEKATGTLTNTIGTIAKNYMSLNNMDSAIVNSDKKGFNGGLENVLARASSSAPGQYLGQALGTQEASVRQEILNSRPALINAIRQATNMSARAMDSNVELQFYLGQVGDPTKDIWSNLSALNSIDKAYGLGNSLKNVLTPEQYARVENGSAALANQFSAQAAPQATGIPDGWSVKVH